MRITSTYRDLNAALHESDPDYGAAAHDLAGGVAIIAHNSDAKTLLDYGCGKGTLKVALQNEAPDLTVNEYDPAIPGKDEEPSPADMVVCIDVLEHVEPETLEAVLAHIKSLSNIGALFVIDTVAAQRELPDGRNAHLLVERLDWWQARIAEHFSIVAAQYLDPNEPRRCLVVGSSADAKSDERSA